MAQVDVRRAVPALRQLLLTADGHGQVTEAFLDALQTNQLVEFLHYLLDVDNLIDAFTSHIAISQQFTFFPDFFVAHPAQTHPTSLNGGIQEVAHIAGVTEGLAAAIVHVLKLNVQLVSRLIIESEAFLLGHAQEYHFQLLGVVVGELDLFLETRGQARVHLQELLHLVAIARRNAYELAFFVLQDRHQLVDTGLAEHIIVQAVSLVDEEHAAHGTVDILLHIALGAAHHIGDEVFARHLDILSFGQHAQGTKHIGEDAGDGGLARAWIADEDEVVGDARLGIGAAFTLRLLDAVDDLVDLVFHALQADKLIQLLPYLGLGPRHKHLASHILFLHLPTVAQHGIDRQFLGLLLSQVAVALDAVALAHQPLEVTLKLLQSLGSDIELVQMFQDVGADLAEGLFIKRGEVETEFKERGDVVVFGQKLLEATPQSRHHHDGHVPGIAAHTRKEAVEVVEVNSVAIGQKFLHIVDDQHSVFGILQILVELVHPDGEIGGIHRFDGTGFDEAFLDQDIRQLLDQEMLARTGLADHHAVHLDVYIGTDGFQLGGGFHTVPELVKLIGDAFLGHQFGEGMTVLRRQEFAAMLAVSRLVTVLGITLCALFHLIFIFPGSFPQQESPL